MFPYVTACYEAVLPDKFDGKPGRHTIYYLIYLNLSYPAHSWQYFLWNWNINSHFHTNIIYCTLLQRHLGRLSVRMESALVHDTHQLGEAIAVSHKKGDLVLEVVLSRIPDSLYFFITASKPRSSFLWKKEREIRPFEHPDHHANQNSFFWCVGNPQCGRVLDEIAIIFLLRCFNEFFHL